LDEGVMMGQRGMAGGKAYWCLVRAGGMQRRQWCRSRGQGAGSALANGGDAMVNNLASSGGAWSELRTRGLQGLGGS